MGVVFSSKSKKHPILLEQVDTPKSSSDNKVVPLGETQKHLVIPPLSARGETLDVTLGGNQSKHTTRTVPATLETTTGKSKKPKREKKEIQQLLENDLVNIVYIEKGSQAPTKVQELVQQEKFVVVPKVQLAPTFMRGEHGDQRIMRVVKPSQDQLQ